MADNTTLNAGTGGDVIATDDIAGVKYQRVKLSVGADGSAADAASGGGTEAGSLRVTIASDSTGVLSVDDNGSSLTVDNGGTFAVQPAGSVAHDAAGTGVNPVLNGAYASAAAPTDVSADGDAVRLWALRNGALATQPTYSGIPAVSGNGASGTGVQRVTIANDSTGVLATVTNVATIGTSVTPGTSAAHLGKAEDAAHASGDTGVMSLAVRRDADTSLVSADGDYAPLQVNAAGSLKVAITSGAGSGGTSAADGSTFTRATTSLTPAGAVVETSAPTLTNGQVAGLSQTTGGALRVAVASGGISGVVNDAALTIGTSEGVPIMGRASAAAPTDVSADNDAVHIWTLRSGAQVVQPSYAGVLATTGNGASGTGVQRVTIANDSTGVLATVTNVATIGTSVTPGTSAAHLGKAEDAAHTTGDTGVFALAVRTDTAAASSGTTGDYEALHTDSVGALWTRSTGELADDAAFTPGTSRVLPVGFTADESATDSVDEGDIGAGRMTLDRKQIVTLQPHTQGGLSIFRSLDIDETEEDVKTSAGQVYWIHAMNMVATARYLKFYNATAASVTVGTTTPVLTLPLPANSTTGAGFTVSIPQGLAFSMAICVACTTGVADADTGAPGANDVIINIGYM